VTQPPRLAGRARRSAHLVGRVSTDGVAPDLDLALIALQMEHRLDRLRDVIDSGARELRALRVECSVLEGALQAAHVCGSKVEAQLSALSSQERHVALRVAQGATNSEVAAALSITEHTVKNHLKSVFRKLKIRSRWQLTHALRALAEPHAEGQALAAHPDARDPD
jgi:DNA-binding CsgD family transcriptional regulator